MKLKQYKNFGVNVTYNILLNCIQMFKRKIFLVHSESLGIFYILNKMNIQTENLHFYVKPSTIIIIIVATLNDTKMLV